jgi:hypothetical protein
MSGQERLHRKQRPAKVKRRRLPILLIVGLVAIGIVISLVLTHYGWVPAETFAP